MWKIANRLSCQAALLMLASVSAYAAIPDLAGHPFYGIAKRNIFGLKTETKTDPIKPAVVPPLATLDLTGITTMLGYKLAVFRVHLPAKPGQQHREQTLMLAEGQRDGDIEILRIDEKNGRVDVRNSGVISTLAFGKNEVKQTSTPPPTIVTPR